MFSLKVKNMFRHFGHVKAVDGLDMEVNKGDFFALLGPSASGKTTLFRCICGVETPDSGAIEIDGKDVTELPVQERGAVMVFQTFALYPHLSIFDNLAFPLVQQGMDRSEIERRIDEIAELLKLKHTLQRKPGTASGGELQRAAIGRALVRKPGLLLLDEPLTNLDAKLRHDMRAEFKRIHRERGITIIYATPDELEALTMGSTIGVLKSGQMQQVGTPDDLYEQPDHSYVAGMVGSPRINLVSAKRSGSDTKAKVTLPFGEISGGDWQKPLSDFAVGEELLLGIRPHDIVPVEKGASFDGFTFEGQIYQTEPLGDIIILDLVARDCRLKMVLPEEQANSYSPGDKLICGFKPEFSHLFAEKTGTAIR